jgi:hypothetical protein
MKKENMQHLERQSTVLKIHFRDENEICSFGLASIINYEGNQTDCKLKTYILAPPWKNNEVNVSRIMNGIYLAKKKNPTKNIKHKHIEILNVPGRTGILIHRFNEVTETEGCMGPGSNFQSTTEKNGHRNYKMIDSEKALNQMLKLLPDIFIVEVL